MKTKRKNNPKPGPPKAVSRREFFKEGAAAGVSAAALAYLGTETATAALSETDSSRIKWHLEADVIVVGAGAAGLPAAISAVDHGATAIIVEAHFDIGGQAIISGGFIHIGGGNRLQKQHKINDSPDLVFKDWTRADNPESRFNDRTLVRVFADENVATFDFLEANGVEFYDTVVGPMFASTVPRQVPTKVWPIAKDWVLGSEMANGGSGLMRALEQSARKKGVQILLKHRMVRVIRENPTSGRILGVTAMEVDEWFQPTSRSVNIRARKGIILATGGHAANVTFRRIFDPKLTEEYQAVGQQLALRNADGVLAGLRLGGSLWGTTCQVTQGDDQLTVSRSRLGCKYSAGPVIFTPESPVFFRIGATGFDLGDWQNAILVKETGRRFYAETAARNDQGYLNAAMAWSGDPSKLDGGGPIWAIFDKAAAVREKLHLEPPTIEPDYFFSGDTLEELAVKIRHNPYQWRTMPGANLRQTVERYNTFVERGKDDDFGKPTPKYKITQPPFYAAWATHVCHDTLAGLRINNKAQVIDLQGNVIPGLYSAGETAGGIALHGLARCIVFGRIAGREAAVQSES
jgi:succinate dehydrogenase/fumarate reductase flavoprotein subunit